MSCDDLETKVVSNKSRDESSSIDKNEFTFTWEDFRNAMRRWRVAIWLLIVWFSFVGVSIPTRVVHHLTIDERPQTKRNSNRLSPRQANSIGTECLWKRLSQELCWITAKIVYLHRFFSDGVSMCARVCVYVSGYVFRVSFFWHEDEITNQKTVQLLRSHLSRLFDQFDLEFIFPSSVVSDDAMCVFLCHFVVKNNVVVSFVFKNAHNFPYPIDIDSVMRRDAYSCRINLFFMVTKSKIIDLHFWWHSPSMRMWFKMRFKPINFASISSGFFLSLFPLFLSRLEFFMTKKKPLFIRFTNAIWSILRLFYSHTILSIECISRDNLLWFFIASINASKYLLGFHAFQFYLFSFKFHRPN